MQRHKHQIMVESSLNGNRCRFIRAQDLFGEMYPALADRSTRRLQKPPNPRA
jgi:hypothetical protein